LAVFKGHRKEVKKTMRVSWIASGAILIILAVILYMLRAAFAFLPFTIQTYYWVIPTIFFLIGIIVLLFGLILPEQHRRAVYYHREPGRRTEQYVRERPPVYTKEQHVERKETTTPTQTTTQPSEQRPAEQHYQAKTGPTTTTTTTTHPLPTYETIEQQPTTESTTTTPKTEIIEERHDVKKIQRG
jgi:FtsZ-interacting cell division protein ZipA